MEINQNFILTRWLSIQVFKSNQPCFFDPGKFVLRFSDIEVKARNASLSDPEAVPLSPGYHSRSSLWVWRFGDEQVVGAKRLECQFILLYQHSRTLL